MSSAAGSAVVLSGNSTFYAASDAAVGRSESAENRMAWKAERACAGPMADGSEQVESEDYAGSEM